LAFVRNATEPVAPSAHVASATTVEAKMDTLVDIGILLAVYASLSLSVTVLMRVLRGSPEHGTHETVTARGW